MARRVCYVCVCLRLHGCRPVGALLAPLRRVNTYMSESLMCAGLAVTETGIRAPQLLN